MLFVSTNEPNTNNRSFSPEGCATPASRGLQSGCGGHVGSPSFLPRCHSGAENALVPSVFWDVGVCSRPMDG